MWALIAPCEEVTLEMNFLEQGFIEKVTELAHPTPV
jgi:hypothetical protein